ncbi:hypothetical protein ACFSLT_26845 [Novosphingobium resinovorum]
MTEGPLTLAEKIWSAHRVMTLESGAEVIAIDRLLLHERTGGVALKSLEEAGRTVMHPRACSRRWTTSSIRSPAAPTRR